MKTYFIFFCLILLVPISTVAAEIKHLNCEMTSPDNDKFIAKVSIDEPNRIITLHNSKSKLSADFTADEIIGTESSVSGGSGLWLATKTVWTLNRKTLSVIQRNFFTTKTGSINSEGETKEISIKGTCQIAETKGNKI